MQASLPVYVSRCARSYFEWRFLRVPVWPFPSSHLRPLAIGRRGFPGNRVRPRARGSSSRRKGPASKAYPGRRRPTSQIRGTILADSFHSALGQEQVVEQQSNQGPNAHRYRRYERGGTRGNIAHEGRWPMGSCLSTTEQGRGPRRSATGAGRQPEGQTPILQTGRHESLPDSLSHS